MGTCILVNKFICESLIMSVNRKLVFRLIWRKEIKMRKIMLIMAGLAVITSLVGCNMYRGLGKDVEDTGKNIQGR